MIESGRLRRLLVLSAAISIAFSAVFYWYTSPEPQSASGPNSKVPPRTSPDNAGSLTVPAVVLYDRRQPRTTRLALLQELLEHQQHNSSASAEDLACTWLAIADISMQLEKFARAQEALECVRRLIEDKLMWHRREADLLQQELSGWEVTDGRQYQLRRDRVIHHERAQQYFSNADFVKAIDEARMAVAAQRELLSISGSPTDGDRARLAAELTLLGCLTLEHSDTYAEAPGILKDASEISRSVHGDQHPFYADVLAALARVDDERGHFDSADSLYTQSLQVLSETRGKNSPEYARVLARQSRMHMEWWKDYGEGKGYAALQIRQTLLGMDHLECAESFEHLGINALSNLNFAKADELLQRALAIRQREQGKNHPDIAEILSWLSHVYIAQGDVARASLSLQQAIQLTTQHRGEHHPRLVRLFANVAHLGEDDWNQPRGEREAKRGIDIAVRAGTSQHPAAFDAMIAMGDLMLEEENPYGLAQLRRIDPKLTAEYTKTVITRHEECPHAQQLPSYATSLINLAHVGYWDDYQSVSRPEAAELLQRAHSNMQRYGNDLHPSYSDYLNVLGRWHFWAGDEDTGRQYLKESLRIVEQRWGIVLSERRARAWRSYAGAFMHAGKYTQEMDDCLQTVSRLDEEIYRQNAAGQCDVDRYGISRARFFSVGVSALHPGIRLSDTERYRQILATKGSTAVLQMSERSLYEKPELKPLFDAVRMRRRQLKSVAYNFPKSDDELARWRESLFTAADEKESCERELAILSRPYLPSTSSLEPLDLQAQLPENVKLIDFVN